MRGVIFSTLLMLLASALSFHVGRGYGSREQELLMECDCAKQVSSISDVTVAVTAEMQVAIDACAAAGGEDVGVNLDGVICMMKYSSSKEAASVDSSVLKKKAVEEQDAFLSDRIYSAKRELYHSCRKVHGLSYSVRDLPMELCVVPASENKADDSRVCEEAGGEFIGWTPGSHALCDLRVTIM